MLVSTVGFPRDNNPEFVEWFKLCFAIPDRQVNLQVEKRVKIATLGFIWLMAGAVFLVLVLLLYCYYNMRKFSDSISSQLNSILQLAEKIENKQQYQ